MVSVLWLLSKARQRCDRGKLLMDFLAFMEETRKENNTYFIDLFIRFDYAREVVISLSKAK